MPDLDPIRLSSQSDVPLYRQLADAIDSSIRKGTMAYGDRLPPTRELADRLGLNRTTVSAAYALLEQSGLVQGHVGRGSFVSYRPGEAVAAATLDWSELLGPVDSNGSLPSTGASAGRSISFSNSRPDETSFPLAVFRRLSREVIDSPEAADILQLGSSYGYEPLRKYLLSEARRAGLARDTDDLLVTNGCQQALHLLARILVRDDCSVLLEDPAYHGLLRVLREARANILPVPVGVMGLEAESLERLAAQRLSRLLVLTPNFQNPTGQTLSLETRHRVLKIAARHRLAVIESNVYGDLRYVGDPLPSLKQLTGGSDVIYLGSYSKIAFPGLRVGWVIAPRSVISRLAAAKQTSDIHSDQLSQAVLLRFAQSGELERHLDRTRRDGERRLATALDACARYLPQGAWFTRPEGGMNLWVELPAPLDAEALLPLVERKGVTFLPGRYFSVRHRHPNALRLSFGGLSPEAISRGVQILGEAASELLALRLDRAPLEPEAALV